MREKVHCFLFLSKEGTKDKKGTEQIPKEKNRENGQQVREINYVNVHTITKHFTQKSAARHEDDDHANNENPW